MSVSFLRRCRDLARRIGLIEDPGGLVQCGNCRSWVIVGDAVPAIGAERCCTPECADELFDRLAY